METQKNPDLVEGFQAGLRVCQDGFLQEERGVGWGKAMGTRSYPQNLSLLTLPLP